MAIPQLQEYGLETMDDEAIREFVASQSTGVLGLPAEDAPYMLPMSYAFDGDGQLYFTYILGGSSRKATLSERAAGARFLVHAVETAFNWRSVSLTGTLSALPDDEYSKLDEVPVGGWRPELLRNAGTSGEVTVYEFEIEARTGVRHTGLPPGLQEDTR